MTEYLTEQEQIQQLKNWLKQYGLTILTGIVLAVIMSSGWQYWQNYRNKILTQASMIYDNMLALRIQDHEGEASTQAKKLLNQYARTPYAQLAAFMLAREAIVKKNYSEAMHHLNWIIDHSKNNSLREIARLRLARILISEKKADAALKTLKKIDDKNFIGLINEIRGDAYLVNNNVNAARNAYRLALNELPNAAITHSILQMKYGNLIIENISTSPSSSRN